MSRDQVLIISREERGYLIDAMMTFIRITGELPPEISWQPDQLRELQILLEHLMRTSGNHPRLEYIGQQVRVTLNKDDPGNHVIIEGQLLGTGEGGNFEILEDDGMIYHCWPALDIQPRRRDA